MDLGTSNDIGPFLGTFSGTILNVQDRGSAGASRRRTLDSFFLPEYFAGMILSEDLAESDLPTLQAQKLQSTSPRLGHERATRLASST
jgi:hypothetical protein